MLGIDNLGEGEWTCAVLFINTVRVPINVEASSGVKGTEAGLFTILITLTWLSYCRWNFHD